MSARRIILMYISEVSGHHSATLAIEKALRMLSADAQILNINAFNYTNPFSEKIVNRLYMGMIKRTPQIWNYLYDNPAIVKKIEGIKKTIHKFNSPKLKNLFDKFNPDMVVCTQAFPCGMVADFKKIYNSPIHLIAVLTDYIPHSYWVYDAVDYYIVPSEEVVMRLIKKSVAASKIRPLGIPFDPKFGQTVIKDKAMQKLKLQPGLPTILIMGGGQGVGPIKTMVKSLERLPSDIQEIIVAGNNNKLYSALKKRIKKYKKRILLFGYADNIEELMSASDMIVTKPGGVTTAEALVKKLPMLIIRPIPGQEASNTRYLMSKAAAIKIDRAKDINGVIEGLLAHPQRLKDLRDSAGRIAKPTASLDIARFLLALPDRRV